MRGVRERFSSIVATAITVGLFFLPFVVLGDIAGLEIVHPMAVAILGGIVASTLFTLGAVPALYLRFGAGAAAAGKLGLKSEPA
jgi:Cu/Ag efflux pump CusA